MANMIRDLLAPEQARLLDDQLRRQQLQEGVTNYGSDPLGKFLTAASGAQRASAGIGMVAERALGGRQIGANEAVAAQYKAKLEDEKAKQLADIESRNKQAEQVLYATPQLGEQRVSALLRAVKADKTGKLAEQVIEKYATPDLPAADDKMDYTKYITTLVNNKTVTGQSATQALTSGKLEDLVYIEPKDKDEDKKPEISLISDFVDVDLDNYTDESIQSANSLLLKANKENFNEAITKARKALIKKKPEDETDYTALQDQIRAKDVEFERLDRLAFEVETNVKSGGKLAEFTEQFKALAGSQDLESALRKSFIKEKNTEMLAYLPPGIASDKDVALVLQGLPDDFVNPEQAASYLRGLAKLKREEANYERFKMEYLKENNGDAKGLSQALNKKALKEYNASYKAIVAANPSYERIYNRAKELVQSGMDSLDVRNQLRTKIVQFERGGNAMRNSQIIIQKLKLEGVLQ